MKIHRMCVPQLPSFQVVHFDLWILMIHEQPPRIMVTIRSIGSCPHDDDDHDIDPFDHQCVSLLRGEGGTGRAQRPWTVRSVLLLVVGNHLQELHKPRPRTPGVKQGWRFSSYKGLIFSPKMILQGSKFNTNQYKPNVQSMAQTSCQCLAAISRT